MIINSVNTNNKTALKPLEIKGSQLKMQNTLVNDTFQKNQKYQIQ